VARTLVSAAPRLISAPPYATKIRLGTSAEPAAEARATSVDDKTPARKRRYFNAYAHVRAAPRSGQCRAMDSAAGPQARSASWFFNRAVFFGSLLARRPRL
jgi:hypothetical protein